MMKRLFLMLMLAIAFSVNADAQGWLNRLKDKAVDAAKNAVERNVERKADKEASDASDAVLNKKKGSKKSKGDEADLDEAEDDDTPVDAKNQKSDFVRGSVILFEDDFAGEQMGEFPSKWDIEREGNAEVASINGKKFCNFATSWDCLTPLMKDMKSYLPEVFTIEWDIFYSKAGDFGQSEFEIGFDKGDQSVGRIQIMYRSGGPDCYGYYDMKKPDTDNHTEGSFDWDQIKKFVKIGQWNHFAVSFNKRALKFYINDNRICNIPNAAAPTRFKFWSNGDYKYRGFTNVILAKGGVDLYERNTTDLSAVEKAIMETGKFVTNNILFETGKATLKPESMAEIQKVADYMKKNPTARFEVQGHTDNQGSDKINDPLSQQRAEAVVKALEGLGCDPFNMRAVGKGSHEPVADNATEAGRAKNRRVEFIKK